MKTRVQLFYLPLHFLSTLTPRLSVHSIWKLQPVGLPSIILPKKQGRYMLVERRTAATRHNHQHREQMIFPVRTLEQA